jgi:hypothetical protein
MPYPVRAHVCGRGGFFHLPFAFKSAAGANTTTCAQDLVQRKYEAFRIIEELREVVSNPALPQSLTSVAMTFLHRFFVYQSSRDFDVHAMAWCCLFVAAKVRARSVEVAGR